MSDLQSSLPDPDTVANTWHSNMAFTLVNTDPEDMEQVYGVLQQNLSPAPLSPSNGFYARAEMVINLAGATPVTNYDSNDQCYVSLGTDTDTFYSTSVSYDSNTAAPSVRLSIDVSGTFTGMPTYVLLQAACSGSYDMTATFDNVAMNVFVAATGEEAIVAERKQVLVNGDFSNGVSPWTFHSTVTRSSFDGSNGQGVITFGGIDSYCSTPTWIQQPVPLIELGQTFSLSADVWTQVPSGTSCPLSFTAGNVEVWHMENVGGYQSWNIRDVRGVANEDSSDFAFYASCTGTAVAAIGFDNVALTYNV